MDGLLVFEVESIKWILLILNGLYIKRQFINVCKYDQCDEKVAKYLDLILD